MTETRIWLPSHNRRKVHDVVAEAAYQVGRMSRTDLLDKAEALLRDTLRLGEITVPTRSDITDIGGTQLYRSMILAEIQRRIELGQFDTEFPGDELDEEVVDDA